MATTLGASILSMEAVLIAENDEQKRRFFAPMQLQDGIGAFGLTEPGAGSDVAAGSTTAVKSGNDYVINGAKCWITNGSFARVHVVFAQTDKARAARVSALSSSKRARRASRSAMSSASWGCVVSTPCSMR
jgi:butyryl-CoA dehydrogenase